MSFTYIEFISPLTNKVASISRSDGASIPIDPANSDYQAYLKSLDEAATL